MNELDNIHIKGVVQLFFELEVIALNMLSEAIKFDRKSLLFARLQEYRKEITNLIFHRQYNERSKIILSLCNEISKRIVQEIDEC